MITIKKMIEELEKIDDKEICYLNNVLEVTDDNYNEYAKLIDELGE